MRKILLGLMLLICALVFAACGCDHTWEPATCLAPKTCSACGETEGGVSDHTWTDADCRSPKTCTGCGATEGDPLAHQWLDADCEQPETCVLCSEIRGETLGHQAGRQQLGVVDYVEATGDYVITCEVCGKELEAGSGAITSFHNGERFYCTVEEYYFRLYAIGKELDISMFLATDADGIWVNELYSDLPDCDLVSRNLFYNEDTQIEDIDDEQSFTQIRTYLGINLPILQFLSDPNLAFHHIYPVMRSCDPQITQSQAQEMMLQLLQSGTTEANGITYTFVMDEQITHLVLHTTLSGT